MTDEIYEQATILRRTKNILKDVDFIMSFPYPELNILKPKLCFSYKAKDVNVDFIDLDKKTREQLKEAILNVVNKRGQEIEEELKQL